MIEKKDKFKSLSFLIRELWRFIRVETCLFITGLALSGYLVFSAPGKEMPFVLLASFLSACSIYSYNHLTDREEDAVNNGRLNLFVKNASGRLIIAACLASSLFFALFLPLSAFLTYALSLSVGMLYSTFRLKRYPIKNLYAGFGFSSSFLMGAAAAGASLSQMMFYLPVPFIAGFIGNLLGDLRGRSGDSKAGLRTLPVVLGVKKSKHVLHACAWSITFLSTSLYPEFVSVIPFMITLSAFLLVDNMKVTRMCLLFSFATMPISLVVTRWM